MDNECFAFERLDVYQKALEFAKIVLSTTICKKCSFNWSDQISRAATSVVLNLAEGSGRIHQKEKKQFYYIARGSIYECVSLLDIGLSIGALDETLRNKLRNQCIAIAKMMTKLIQSVKAFDN